MRIKPIQLGLPVKTGIEIKIRVISFDTDAITCSLYYEVRSEAGERLAEGNINLEEEEFSRWGNKMSYIEDLVLDRLGLARMIEVPMN